MVSWKFLLFAQYPAFFLLAIYFLVRYLLVRKSSAIMSVIWVLLFGASLAVSVLFAVLGLHMRYWALTELFKFSLASWIGIVLFFVTLIAQLIHILERRHSQKIMERELEKAAKERDDAVAQARAEGAEAAALAQEEKLRGELLPPLPPVQDAGTAQPPTTEFGDSAQAPIELTFDTPGAE